MPSSERRIYSYQYEYASVLIGLSERILDILPSLLTCQNLRYARGPSTSDDNFGDAPDPVYADSPTNDCKNPKADLPLSMKSFIDAEYTDHSINPKVGSLATCLRPLMAIPHQVRNGVKMGEGDGTVSLLSLGAMCVEGWKRRRWNPAGINITTVEVSLSFHVMPCVRPE